MRRLPESSHRNDHLRESHELRRDFIKIPLAAALAAGLTLAALPSLAQQLSLPNVSYDPTRQGGPALAQQPHLISPSTMTASPQRMPVSPNGPPIGIILSCQKDELLVEYALRA